MFDDERPQFGPEVDLEYRIKVLQEHYADKFAENTAYMVPPSDLRIQTVGKTFGYWTVLRVCEEISDKVIARCVCGVERAQPHFALRHGLTTSCGCSNPDKERSLNVDQIREIKRSMLHKVDLAKKYDVSITTIWNAINMSESKLAALSEKNKALIIAAQNPTNYEEQRAVA